MPPIPPPPPDICGASFSSAISETTASVVKSKPALENAASIAGLLLTTEAVVSEIAEVKEAPQMSGGGGGMGGMM